jgi:hypothetical protein
MAKMFYTATEAAAKLGKTEDDLKAMAREGKLREFRDAGSVNYKIADIDQLAGDSGGAPPAAVELDLSGDTGEIVLEPVEDSSIELSPSGTDILEMDSIEFDDTATGAQLNEGSSVPSVGISVFDDDGDEETDPLAKTAVTDLAGMALEDTGSGSGIMDLSRESDDTSLGQELLDEIYTDDQEQTVDMGDDTRAGLDEAMPEGSAAGASASAAFAVEEDEPGEVSAMLLGETGGNTGDPASAALTAALAVAVIIMGFGGLATAALVRGTMPGMLQWISTNMMIFAGGAVGLSIIAAGITFVLAKRSS